MLLLLLLPKLGAGEHPGVALQTEAQSGDIRVTLPLLSAGHSLDLRADDAILYQLDNSWYNIVVTHKNHLNDNFAQALARRDLGHREETDDDEAILPFLEG